MAKGEQFAAIGQNVGAGIGGFIGGVANPILGSTTATTQTAPGKNNTGAIVMVAVVVVVLVTISIFIFRNKASA